MFDLILAASVWDKTPIGDEISWLEILLALAAAGGGGAIVGRYSAVHRMRLEKRLQLWDMIQSPDFMPPDLGRPDGQSDSRVADLAREWLTGYTEARQTVILLPFEDRLRWTAFAVLVNHYQGKCMVIIEHEGMKREDVMRAIDDLRGDHIAWMIARFKMSGMAQTPRVSEAVDKLADFETYLQRRLRPNRLSGMARVWAWRTLVPELKIYIAAQRQTKVDIPIDD